MSIIDDLNATKQRLAQWQAEQEKVHNDAIAQVKQHVQTQTAQIDAQIAAEKARAQ